MLKNYIPYITVSILIAACSLSYGMSEAYTDKPMPYYNNRENSRSETPSYSGKVESAGHMDFGRDETGNRSRYGKKDADKDAIYGNVSRTADGNYSINSNVYRPNRGDRPANDRYINGYDKNNNDRYSNSYGNPYGNTYSNTSGEIDE